MPSSMAESIALDVHLQAFVRRDTPRRWVATCPLIGVVSQGRSADDAKRCLHEAIELWFESCVERGVLDQALREANFKPSQRTEGLEGSRRNGRPRNGVLGESFDIHLTIPAYRATA
jgi:predicted RNase H-like HicB family nuclease